jgi:CheY-like chemotaxis protein
MDRAGKQQVLVNDEDQDIRDTMRVILEDAGYLVYEAPDGEPALQQLLESQARMVVLVDLNMPGMDGRQLLAPPRGPSQTRCRILPGQSIAQPAAMT